ncbi:MAG: hypothetical protein HZR80_20965 [Candidatus Heimdallarchaeota archaeon]
MSKSIGLSDISKQVFDETQQAINVLEEKELLQKETIIFLCKFWLEAQGFVFSTNPGKIIIQAYKLKEQKDVQHGSADSREDTTIDVVELESMDLEQSLDRIIEGPIEDDGGG